MFSTDKARICVIIVWFCNTRTLADDVHMLTSNDLILFYAHYSCISHALRYATEGLPSADVPLLNATL